MFAIRDTVLWSAGVYRPDEVPWVFGERGRPLGRRLLTSGGTAALGVVALLAVNIAAQGGSRAAFSRWSWRSTLIVLAASVALFGATREPSGAEDAEG